MIRPLLTALLACAGLAAAGCGDDDESAGTDTSKRPATSPPATTGERTTPPGTGTGGAITQKPDPKKASVSLAVTGLVVAVEQGDAARACRLMGQRAGGSGVAWLKICGGRAGVDVDRLPSSDELSITSVKVSGRSAVVRLAAGSTMRLSRSGGDWQVVGYTPPRIGQP
jgi:hypothetical protein